MFFDKFLKFIGYVCIYTRTCYCFFYKNMHPLFLNKYITYSRWAKYAFYIYCPHWHFFIHRAYSPVSSLYRMWLLNTLHIHYVLPLLLSIISCYELKYRILESACTLTYILSTLSLSLSHECSQMLYFVQNWLRPKVYFFVSASRLCLIDQVKY